MKRYFSIVVLLTLFGLSLVACGGNGGNTAGERGENRASSGMQQVQVKETDFKIVSSVTTFVPGTPYHFVVTNDGKTAHEFMILPQSEGNMENMKMGMGHMHETALAFIAMIHPGETKMVDYRFPSSSADSHPEFVCYMPGHYEAGMKERVSVSS